MKAEDVQAFLQQLTAWGRSRPGILALALVGSWAGKDATLDSDVDVIILARQPEALLGDRSWVNRFGQVTRLQEEPYGKVTSLRCWYADGLEVEFGITDAAWAALPLDPGARQVIADGMHILFERDGMLGKAAAEARGNGGQA